MIVQCKIDYPTMNHTPHTNNILHKHNNRLLIAQIHYPKITITTKATIHTTKVIKTMGLLIIRTTTKPTNKLITTMTIMTMEQHIKIMVIMVDIMQIIEVVQLLSSKNSLITG